EVMAPNYIGPFVSVGRVFAPKYRQASLYTQLTLRDDAREARQFAYGDVREAFRSYLNHDNGGRPFLIVGVEQGGTLALRLWAECCGSRGPSRRPCARREAGRTGARRRASTCSTRTRKPTRSSGWRRSWRGEAAWRLIRSARPTI